MKAEKFIAPAETVDCPVHHLPLKVTKEGGRTYAVCNCPVNPNPYAGRAVWERLPDPDQQGAA